MDELKLGDFGKEISHAALNQDMCASAGAVFVHTAIFQRSKWKYKQRGYRYIYMDAGHIAENLALAAVALELGSCHIGAIFDDEANMGLFEKESWRYVSSIITSYFKFVQAGIKKVQDLGIGIKVIGPSHGPVYRKDPMWIVKKYAEWSSPELEKYCTDFVPFLPY